MQELLCLKNPPQNSNSNHLTLLSCLATNPNGTKNADKPVRIRFCSFKGFDGYRRHFRRRHFGGSSRWRRRNLKRFGFFSGLLLLRGRSRTRGLSVRCRTRWSVRNWTKKRRKIETKSRISVFWGHDKYDFNYNRKSMNAKRHFKFTF